MSLWRASSMPSSDGQPNVVATVFAPRSVSYMRRPVRVAKRLVRVTVRVPDVAGVVRGR